VADGRLGDEPKQHVLIWARPERAAKGPKPSSSRREIAATAVALADAEGLTAVSMRKAASALEIAAASVYGYVNNKDELFDLMVDWVHGEDGALPPLSRDCRSNLSRVAHRDRKLILCHPWMTSLAAGRPNFGPNSLAWAEYTLAAIEDQDVSIDEMLIAAETLHAFAFGFAARQLADQRALKRAGLTFDQWGRVVAPYISSVLGDGEHPLLKRVVESADPPHIKNRQQLLFTAGLDRVLDGLFMRSTAPSSA
jgi:AcrR family transcriptional regulator